MATLTSTGAIPNDFAIIGIAGVMIVASRISMKNAPATSSAIPVGKASAGRSDDATSSPGAGSHAHHLYQSRTGRSRLHNGRRPATAAAWAPTTRFAPAAPGRGTMEQLGAG